MHTSIHEARVPTRASKRLVVRVRTYITSAVFTLPLIVASILIVAPLVWAFGTSLKTPAQSFSVPPQWIPTHWDWSNYRSAFDQGFGTWMLNSAKVSSAVVAGQVVTSVLAGYAFARFQFPGRNLIFSVVLAMLMIPLQATIIPIFVLISKLGINDSLLALILPNLVSPFGIFLLRQYFLTLPNELEEAAIIDGAGVFRVFWSIYLPLVTPGIAILSILAFKDTWNDYFRALIFLSSPNNATVPLGIVNLFGYMGTGSVSVVMAGVILSLAIVLTVYIVGQRYLIEGLTAGSLKN